MRGGMRAAGLALFALPTAALLASVFAGAGSAGNAFLGKNGKIAFALAPPNSDGEKIWQMNADGSGRKQLTRTAPCSGVNCAVRIDWTPAWSPNGTKIVFTSSRDGGGSYQLWVMNADGSGQKQLTRTRSIRKVYEANPAWSPDGKKIAFTSNGSTGSQDVYVINADGSGRKRLTRLEGYYAASSPAWSPDGTKIAFGSGSSIGAVVVMNADGSGQTPLYEGTNLGGGGNGGAAPTWSPDGAKIVFTGPGSPGLDALWVMNADGSGQKQLTVNGPPRNAHYQRPQFAQPSWSPDGRKIVFWRVEYSKGIHRPRISAISVMNPDGSGQRSISSTGDDPDWGSVRKR